MHSLLQDKYMRPPIRVGISPQVWSSPPSASKLFKQLLELPTSVYILSVKHIKARRSHHWQWLINTFQRWQHATRIVPYQFCQSRTPKPRSWTSYSQASPACLPLSKVISPSTWTSTFLCCVYLGWLCLVADVFASTYGDCLRLIVVRTPFYPNKREPSRLWLSITVYS